MYITIHAKDRGCADNYYMHFVNSDKILFVKKPKDDKGSIIQIQDYGILYVKESYDEVMKLLSK